MHQQNLLKAETTSAAIVGVAGGEYKVAEPSASEVAYFADTEGIIHVFDFDYDAVVANQVQLQQNCTMCCPCMLPCWFSCFKQNLIDSINAQHVAITRDGIRFVHDQRRQGCRLDCQTAGKTTKTIPFDKLTIVTLKNRLVPVAHFAAWSTTSWPK